MRSRAFSTAAIATSVVMLAGLTVTSADAATRRELKACWQAPTGSPLPLTVTVRGPQFGQRTLDNGTCKAWNVPSGTYRLTANATAIRTAFNASPQGRATVCGKSSYHNFRVFAVVTRGTSTRTVLLNESGGTVSVGVKQGRLTKVNFRLRCTE